MKRRTYCDSDLAQLYCDSTRKRVSRSQQIRVPTDIPHIKDQTISMSTFFINSRTYYVGLHSVRLHAVVLRQHEKAVPQLGGRQLRVPAEIRQGVLPLEHQGPAHLSYQLPKLVDDDFAGKLLCILGRHAGDAIGGAILDNREVVVPVCYLEFGCSA
jgi:hypothetical protein